MITKPESIANDHKAKKWEDSSMTFAAYAATKHVPLGGTFELTPRCNFKCKMCYVRLEKNEMDKIGRELSAGEWISIAKEAVNAGTLNLLITGGEPLIRDDFKEIFEALTKMGFIITLNTNAALMTPELVKFFKKYPPTATNVTLYGASRDTYKKICGNADGFDKTVDGLDMLAEVPTELEVRTTFIKDNMHELNEIRSLSNRYTKRFAINPMVFKPVRGAVSDAENCRMSPSEVYDLAEDNMKYYSELNGSETAEIANMETDNFAKAKDFGFDLPPKIITCLGAKSVYWIAWDGKMIPCGSFSSPYTLPLEEGFKPAWDRLPTLFENISLPVECQSCEFSEGACANCPANLQAESGHLDKISPYICGVTKERAKRNREYMEKF